jgi:MYXO-CTERM domain-containing protein
MKRFLVAAGLLMQPLVSSAYVVKQTSTGADVHWADGSVIMTPALTPVPSGVTTDEATIALRASVATWQAALDGTGVALELAPDPVTPASHVNDGVNSVRFAVAPDDADVEPGVLALTFISFQTGTGVAVDADVVMNASDFTWTTGVTACVKEYDLESALTHELGHALGLAHALGHSEATMYATGQACETTKRTLADDDQAGLDSLYRTPGMTDPGMGAGGCSTSRNAGFAMLPLVLALALALRRRRRLAVVAAVAVAFPVGAAQLRQLTIEELSRDAVMVVHGRVIAVATTPDGAIETDVTIVVDDCIAGTCPATVIVRRRGGERDGVGVWVDAEAQSAVGTEVVTYLRRDRSGTLRVLGGVQGLWQIVDHFAVRDLRGQHVLVDGQWQAGDAEVVELDVLRARTFDARVNLGSSATR